MDAEEVAARKKVEAECKARRAVARPWLIAVTVILGVAALAFLGVMGYRARVLRLGGAQSAKM